MKAPGLQHTTQPTACPCRPGPPTRRPRATRPRAAPRKGRRLDAALQVGLDLQASRPRAAGAHLFPSDPDSKRKILRDTLAISALTLLATAVTPRLTAAAAIAKFVLRAIPQVLVRNRDDQVGLYYLSLNRMEHYPNAAAFPLSLVMVAEQLLIQIGI